MDGCMNGFFVLAIIINIFFKKLLGNLFQKFFEKWMKI